MKILYKKYASGRKHPYNDRRDWKNSFFNNEELISMYQYDFSTQLNFFYKFYFLYFFWSLFYFNKIFFYFNKIFFNLWNRFYYFFNNSYNLEYNVLFYSYLMLYQNNNIFKYIEFESTWKYYFNFIKKKMTLFNKKIKIDYDIWKNYYYYLFLLNDNNMKNKIFRLYNKYIYNLNIYKIYNNNVYTYLKEFKNHYIFDNLWKKNYNYKIYYNYNFLSIWKVISNKQFELTSKPSINKKNIEYKKIDNLLEYLLYNEKILVKDNLIDSKLQDDIYIEKKFIRNKKKIWYK